MEQTSVSYLHMPVTSRIDRVAARHAERKSHHWIKWLLLLMLTVGFGFGLWKGAVWLLGNTFMAVQGVEVNGLNYLNREEIDKALQGFKLDNTLEADTASIERQLATLDYVAEVSAEKVYPNRIVINIKERLPVAYSMQGGNLVALSADGYPLPVDARLGAPAMPIFFGDVVSQGKTDDQVELSRNMLGLLGVLRVELPQLYAQIESVKSSAQTLRLTDGSIVICGLQNSKEDFARLCAVRSLINSQGEKASSFDLRYKNQVIVKSVTGGMSAANDTRVIIVDTTPKANPTNALLTAKKDGTVKKTDVDGNQPLEPMTVSKTDSTNKTDNSLAAGPKSRVKPAKSTAAKSGKKVGR
jgi:cell division protein FtsQ